MAWCSGLWLSGRSSTRRWSTRMKRLSVTSSPKRATTTSPLLGLRRRPDGDHVAVAKARAVHAVAPHGQEVVRSRREALGHHRRDPIDDSRFGDDRLAGGDLSRRVHQVDEREVRGRLVEQPDPALDVPSEFNPTLGLQGRQVDLYR